MKRWLFAGALALLAACGGDSGGPAGGQPSGTLFGSPFSGVDAAAVVAAPASCTVPPFGTVSLATLVLGFGDQAGLCTSVQQPCVERPNGRTVTVVVVRGGQQAQGPIAAGTYAITTGTPVPDANNVVTFATAIVARKDAACADVANAPDATGGTVTITSVSGTEVKGTVDIAFSDGGRIAGPFDARACNVALDVCAQQVPACSTAPTCQP